MRRSLGDDGAVACCVSPMLVGNKCSSSVPEPTWPSASSTRSMAEETRSRATRSAPEFKPVEGEYLSFDDVLEKYETMMEWLAGVYVNAMNVIHYMHDKYAYERLEMALHDYRRFERWLLGSQACP